MTIFTQISRAYVLTMILALPIHCRIKFKIIAVTFYQLSLSIIS
jgi:hypothetical protein